MTVAGEFITAEARGAGFSARIFTAGEGQPLVFVHGFLPPGPDDPVIAELARHFRVVAPVHPGFVDLTETDRLHDVRDLALYYDDLLETLNLKRVPVVGHSFGGMVAAELAAHVPTRIAHLVLAAPYGLWRDDAPVADVFPLYPATLLEVLWTDPGSQATLDILRAAFEGEGLAGDDPRLAMLLAMATGLTTIGKYIWPVPDKGLRRRLHRISAPTLVVWGEDDRLIPPIYSDEFCAGIAEAKAETLSGAGHMAPYEQPAAFAAQVVRALAE